MTPNNNLCGLIVGTEMIAKITSLDKQTNKKAHSHNEWNDKILFFSFYIGERIPLFYPNK